MGNISNQDLLHKCLKLIEDKLGWGRADDWHNQAFVELSKAIQKETDILLSVSTLKRVWGKVNNPHDPSSNTLDALAVFAGYNNWMDFRFKAIKSEVQSEESSDTKRSALSFNWFKYVAFIGVFSIAIFFITTLSSNTEASFDINKVSFSSHPVTMGVPNSVIFDLDIDVIDSDDIKIQQFWDTTKTILLKPKQQQATGIYYFPGYFRAKLIVDDQIVKEHELFIESNSWIGTLDYDPIPKYLKTEEINGQGILSMPQNYLDEIKESESALVSTYHIVKDFGDLSGDDFSLKTSVRNLYSDKWAVCQKLRLVVLGSSGAMIFPFAIPGCASDLNLMLNDVLLRGKESDLSSLGIDLSDFMEIEIKVSNKLASIYLEGEQVYQAEYNESIGKIVGVRYRFLGAGEVEHLQITTEEKELLFENFNSL